MALTTSYVQVLACGYKPVCMKTYLHVQFQGMISH